MAGGENPGPGRPENTWAHCLADGIRVFRATEGSTDRPSLLFGVDTVSWPRAVKTRGKLYRAVVDAADPVMTGWHTCVAEKS